MVMSKAKDTTPGKLVNNIPLVSLDIPVLQKPSTKKRIRRIAEPHIRGHQVKGRVYYTYCRGTDREVYLGDADAILKAVKSRG
jgi:ribosomal protein S20